MSLFVFYFSRCTIPEGFARFIPRVSRELKRNLLPWGALVQRLQLEGRYRLIDDSLHVHLLSLVRSRSRRQLTVRSLRDQNVSFHLFHAVDGLSVLEQGLIDEYAGPKKRQRLAQTSKWDVSAIMELDRAYRSHRLRDKALRSALHERLRFGCYISHVLVWKRMLELGLPFVVVLEDDVVLRNSFKSRLVQLLKSLPRSWGLLYLNGTNRKLGPEYSQNLSISKGGVGMFGYVISSAGALHFLETAARHSDKAIDHMMDEEVLTGKIVAFHATPVLVDLQSDVASTLAY